MSRAFTYRDDEDDDDDDSGSKNKDDDIKKGGYSAGKRFSCIANVLIEFIRVCLYMYLCLSKCACLPASMCASVCDVPIQLACFCFPFHAFNSIIQWCTSL